MWNDQDCLINESLGSQGSSKLESLHDASRVFCFTGGLGPYFPLNPSQVLEQANLDEGYMDEDTGDDDIFMSALRLANHQQASAAENQDSINDGLQAGSAALAAKKKLLQKVEAQVADFFAMDFDWLGHVKGQNMSLKLSKKEETSIGKNPCVTAKFVNPMKWWEDMEKLSFLCYLMLLSSICPCLIQMPTRKAFSVLAPILTHHNNAV
jgi:hypothetical protein